MTGNMRPPELLARLIPPISGDKLSVLRDYDGLNQVVRSNVSGEFVDVAVIHPPPFTDHDAVDWNVFEYATHCDRRRSGRVRGARAHPRFYPSLDITLAISDGTRELYVRRSVTGKPPPL